MQGWLVMGAFSSGCPAGAWPSSAITRGCSGHRVRISVAHGIVDSWSPPLSPPRPGGAVFIRSRLACCDSEDL